MLYKEYIRLGNLSIHKIGNKAEMEGVSVSSAPIDVDENLSVILKEYFLMAFNEVERCAFTHPTLLSLNVVYTHVADIFDKYESFHENSIKLAKYLYEKCSHPNIKSGEFYVVYFQDCILDGETVNAIGLFKSENKDTFIQLNTIDGGYRIESLTGININKLDKGCLIFNTHKDEGYVVSVVDNSNRGEAKYWVEDFLQVKRKNDSYTQTQNAMAMCKNFISQLPPDIDKAEKAAMMNRVVDGLKQDSVNIDLVADKAFGPELSVGFNSFRNEYQETHEVSFDASFQGKPEAIKRRATGTMTTLKLDKNFDVHIHGGEQFIERGYDEEKGMRYYKLYFNEER